MFLALAGSSLPLSQQGKSYVLLVCLHAKLLQSCPILCNSKDCSLPGSSVLGFSREEYWNGFPCPEDTRDLPEPRIGPESLAIPALQVDSLLLGHWRTPICCLGIIKLMKTPYRGRVSRPA